MKFILWIISLFKKPVEEMEYIPVVEIPVVKPTTKIDRLLEIIKDELGRDVTPLDKVSDEVACSEVVSTILQGIFEDFPILASTKDLDTKLFMDKRFERVLEPQAGAIIVSPRTATTFGHVGFMVDNTNIVSNDSNTGLFKKNYNFDSWINEFKVKRGLRIYIYRIVV